MNIYTIGNTTFDYDVLDNNTLKKIVGYNTNNQPLYDSVLKLWHYTFTYNDDGYIVACSGNKDSGDWYGQASVLEKEYGVSISYGCFKLVNGKVVFDENKYNELKAIETKQNRINELKQKLTETDYIYNSIREGGRSEEYYAEVIENRKAWRKEIQDLEEELGL